MEKEIDLYTAGLDEIVFEDRNKAYGGYFLRVWYEKNVTKAVVITSAAFIIAAACIHFYYKFTAKPIEVLVPVKVEMELTEEPKEEEMKKLPPPPPKIDPPKVEEVKFVPPVIKIDRLVKKDEQLREQDSLLAAPNISDRDVKGENKKKEEFDDFEDGSIGGTGTEKTEEVFTFAQEMPKFKGTSTQIESAKALEKFVNNRIVYPEASKQRKIEGVVYVKYTVTKEGKVTDVQIVQGRGLDPAIDAEAIRVIKSLPDFTPANQNGVLRNVTLTQRIKFTLQTQ